MAGGYITANRDDYRWFMDRKRDEPHTEYEAYLSLCMMAAYKPRVERVGMKTITVNRGEVIRTEAMLADDWHWSRKQVNRFITRLAGTKECPKNCPSSVPALSRKVSQGITILVIDNYDAYVCDDSESVPALSQECPEKGPESVPLSIKRNKKEEQITPPEAKASFPQGGSPLPEQQETTATAAPDTTFSVKTPASPVDDSEAADKAITLPTPSKAHSGARKRVKEASGIDFDAIKTAFRHKRPKDSLTTPTKERIKAIVAKGTTPDELIRCVERYQTTIESAGEERFVQDMATFFGTRKATWEKYLDENFTEPEPPKVVNAFSSLDRLRVMLEEQGCRMPTRYSDEDIADMCAFEAKLQSEKEVAVG